MFFIQSTATDLCLIPVAFDHMLFLLSQKAERVSLGSTLPVRFETEQYLESNYLDRLCADIEALHRPVCLDMRYVASYVSRGFAVFHEKQLPVFFCGLKTQMVNLMERLQQDMPSLRQYEHDEVLCTNHPDIQILASKQDFLEDVEKLYQEKLCNLLNSVVIRAENPQKGNGDQKKEDEPGILLESSAVYVNRYVALKDLFQHMEEALFIIYMMAEKVRKKFPTQDNKVLICCSKTGAVFTGILSMLLGMKAIYCISIGPKFALDVARLKKEVQAGQDYIFVFDFLCMGTEAKILHALVSSLDANLVYGIGVANYLNLSEKNFEGSIFSKLETLIDIHSAVPDYTVWPVITKNSEATKYASQ